jgi:sec-independent protein translocase protein TatB
MGLSFGEIVVLAVIALVVIGPKDLPKLLRAAGRMIGQARRAITDVKRETGLDDVLRGDFRDLERLADHIEELGPYRGDANEKLTPKGEPSGHRTREYPPIGADSATLLPEDADVYPDAPALASATTVLGSIDALDREGREGREGRDARDAKAAS